MKRHAALWMLMLALSAPASGQLQDGVDGGGSSTPFALPDGARLLADQSYGNHRLQHYDVYLPSNAQRAPVIFMVHGGAWRAGDKANAQVVQNKVRRWTARGVIVVSVNYRLLPGASVAAQAVDVAAALAAAQAQAASWGGDRSKFVLMGHSAGAHLVALLASAPPPDGVTPWLGAVALDSAAMDVPALMAQRHFPFYDRVFGSDAAYWRSVSPVAQLKPGAAPLLAVCSSRRQDSCPQAEAYATRARAQGMRVQVLPQNLSHMEINATLGQPGAYTDAVETFLAGLDASFGARP
jgi:acetyl esterase/lipase